MSDKAFWKDCTRTPDTRWDVTIAEQHEHHQTQCNGECIALPEKQLVQIRRHGIPQIHRGEVRVYPSRQTTMQSISDGIGLCSFGEFFLVPLDANRSVLGRTTTQSSCETMPRCHRPQRNKSKRISCVPSQAIHYARTRLESILYVEF